MDFELWWKLFKCILVNFEEVIVVNAHLLWIELWMVKYIYVEWIVNVLVIAYMSGDDELLMNS